MSTVSSRQRPSTATQQTRRPHAGRREEVAKDDILVLIRLPDLSEACGSEEASMDSMMVAASSQTTVSADLPSPDASSGIQQAAEPTPSAETTDEAAELAAASQSAALSQLAKAMAKMDMWRYAGPMAGVALVAVLMIAVGLLLFGDGGSERSDLPTDQHRVASETDPSIIETPFSVEAPQTAESSVPPTTPGLPQLPPAPAVPAQPSPPVAAQSAEPADAVSPSPPPASDAITPDVTPSAEEAIEPPVEPLLDGPIERVAEQPAQDPIGEASAVETETPVAPSTEEPPVEPLIDSNDITPVEPDSSQQQAITPLRGGADDAAQEVNRYQYPATDPGTWNPDYSPVYQELFLNPRAGGQNRAAVAPKNNSQWEPNTARLHPEMSAPPIR